MARTDPKKPTNRRRPLIQFLNRPEAPATTVVHLDVAPLEVKTEPIETVIRYTPCEPDPEPVAEAIGAPIVTEPAADPQVVYCFNDFTDADDKSKPVVRNGAVVENNVFSDLVVFETEYPVSTDVLCWNCCHGFLGKPLGMPVARVAKGIQSFGCFCSFQCAYRYHLDTRRGDLVLLKQMHASTDTGDLFAAPPREVLGIFGGGMSIDEYRNMKRTDHVTFEGIQILYPITRQFNDTSCSFKRDPSAPTTSRNIDKLLRRM